MAMTGLIRCSRTFGLGLAEIFTEKCTSSTDRGADYMRVFFNTEHLFSKISNNISFRVNLKEFQVRGGANLDE